MSGGQQQRVALARALVNHPKVLLLDEPLGALDLKLRKQMQLELKRIQQEVGITFIYVTHDQEEAMTMSDRLAVMRQGKIEQIGRARGGLREPGHRVRGRVPRRVEHAGRRGPGDARTALTTIATLHRWVRARPHGPDPVGCRLACPGRRAAGEDHDRSGRVARRRPSGNHRQRLLRMSTYIGVNYQYKVEGPGGNELTVVRAEPRGGGHAAAPGEQVRLLEWLPSTPSWWSRPRRSDRRGGEE